MPQLRDICHFRLQQNTIGRTAACDGERRLHCRHGGLHSRGAMTWLLLLSLVLSLISGISSISISITITIIISIISSSGAMTWLRHTRGTVVCGGLYTNDSVLCIST